MRLIILFRFILLLTITVTNYPQAVLTSEENIEIIEENLTILASDEFMGRETGTMGEKLASEYIAGRLQEYGLKPFGDNGTYFQNFELTEGSFEKGSAITLIDEHGNRESFEHGVDVSYSLRKLPSKNLANKKLKIVFAGYGVQSDVTGYNDYSEIDVIEKVVIVLHGVPKKDGNDLLTGEEAAFLSSSYQKYELAKSKGAAGVIILPDKAMIKRWGYMQLSAFVVGHSLNNLKDEGSKKIPLLFINEDVAEYLFEDEIISLEEINNNVSNDILAPSFQLNKAIEFNFETSMKIDTVKNILGIVEGNDNELKNELITIGAHYDHEGIKNDEIYNGADDNASGTAAVLEVARRLADLKDNRRSIIAIFHTAEEKGLLGSKYLTENSNFLDDAVVNINLDMVGRESSDSIYSVGSGKLSTELYELCETVNKETVNFGFNYKFDDPADKERIYYRSDHYNYAKQGIPIVFYTDNMKEDYHKPTDDSYKINYEKIEKVCTLVTELALRIANMDHRLIVDK